ncbi:hypothetical protein RUA4292_02676 [Ruegeria atlantica]|uniref:Uncharacterized protein n=1 Tax=Ruegeria atlantica TaxID=81569 RepID=A0A0P1EYD1_9RHOB|nr:hypothetical protein RUA4292_02676 [Ruegeria atlantica]
MLAGTFFCFSYSFTNRLQIYWRLLLSLAAHAAEVCKVKTARQSVSTETLCSCKVVDKRMLRYIHRRADFEDILARTSQACPLFAAILTDIPTATVASSRTSDGDGRSASNGGSESSGSNGGDGVPGTNGESGNGGERGNGSDGRSIGGNGGDGDSNGGENSGSGDGNGGSNGGGNSSSGGGAGGGGTDGSGGTL